MGRRGHVWPRKDRGFWCTLKGKQTFLSFDRDEAEKEFHRLKAATEPAPANGASVLRLVHLYLEDRHREIAPDTYVLYRAWLQRWVEAYGRRRARDLKPLDITSWLRDHPEWNASTKNTAVSVIKTWSRWCAREQHLEVDRLRDARKPKPLKRQPADPDELRKLERAIGDPDFRDFFTFLLDTGCRPGEARTLTASQVDWKASTARVRGKTGWRTIGITKRAMAILRRLAKRHPTGAILRPADRDEWEANYFKRQWDRWLKAAGISARIVPYSLRHDLAARWISLGVDGMLASKQLGHASTNRTISTYLHPSGESLADAADQGSRGKPRKRG